MNLTVGDGVESIGHRLGVGHLGAAGSGVDRGRERRDSGSEVRPFDPGLCAVDSGRRQFWVPRGAALTVVTLVVVFGVALVVVVDVTLVVVVGVALVVVVDV